MTMASPVSREALTETLVQASFDVEGVLTKPTSDWLPTAMIAFEGGRIAVADLSTVPGEEWGRALVALCEAEGATAVAVGATVLTQPADSEEEVLDPQKLEEVLLVLSWDYGGEQALVSPVTRYPNRPPTLSRTFELYPPTHLFGNIERWEPINEFFSCSSD